MHIHHWPSPANITLGAISICSSSTTSWFLRDIFFTYKNPKLQLTPKPSSIARALGVSSTTIQIVVSLSIIVVAMGVEVGI